MIYNKNLLLKKEKYIITNITIFFLLLIFYFLYIYNLTGWLLHDDEGGYLYQAWRMNEGEIPYRDFYSPQEPLFLFTGYIIFKIFGPEVFWVRLFTVIVTILTGYLIFLIGKRIYKSDKIALLGLILYLTLSIVYSQARLYRSDAHAVFFSTIGLFLFIKAWQDNKRSFFICSGAIYAISLGYKFSTTLGIAALLIFILYQVLIERDISIIKSTLLPFVIGFAGTITILLIILNNIAPSFLTCIIGHQATQPLLCPSNLITTIINNIKEFFMINPLQYGLREGHPWLIIFSFPALIQYLFTKRDLKKIFTFYIFNICWVLLNPYIEQTLRYLLYLLPVAILVFVSFVFYLFQPHKNILVKLCGLVMLVFVLIKILIPGLIKNTVLFSAKENGTLGLAKYIRDNTQEKDYVMTDYGDILFHAKRKTTPLMAGMSKSAVDNGVITSDRLIIELKSYPVKMILIHREGKIPENLGFFFGTPFEPHHFSSLINSKDGAKFMDYLRKHYLLIDTFTRTGQIFDIYIKK